MRVVNDLGASRVRVVEKFFDGHPHNTRWKPIAFGILGTVREKFPNAGLAWVSWGWPHGSKRRFSVVIRDTSFAQIKTGKEIPILEVE